MNLAAPSFDRTYFLLVLTTSCLAALCSLVVILIIRELKKKMKYSGHLQLILVMSFFQMIYDLTFFSTVYDFGNNPYTIFSDTCQNLFGCGGALYSNYIALVTFYVVKFRRVVNLNDYYYWLMGLSLLPGVIISILYSFEETIILSNSIYVYFRIASIVVNFFLSGWTASIIFAIRSNKKVATTEDKALNLLAIRMLYYPIVQVLSRSVISWYELENATSFNYTSCSENICIALLIAVLLNPAASYGYLITFLIMQPRAKACFQSMFLCGMFPPSKTTRSPTSDMASAVENAIAAGDRTTGVRASSMGPQDIYSDDFGLPARTLAANSITPFSGVLGQVDEMAEDDFLMEICVGERRFSETFARDSSLLHSSLVSSTSVPYPSTSSAASTSRQNDL